MSKVANCPELTGLSFRYNTHCIIFVPVAEYETVNGATCTTKINRHWSLANIDGISGVKATRLATAIEEQLEESDKIAVNFAGKVANFDGTNYNNYNYVACEDRKPIIQSKQVLKSKTFQ